MITILANSLSYNKDTKTFLGSEKNIPFATEYQVKNPKTGKSEIFKFKHSTGPEFDPKTRWIYEGPDGLKLEIANDAEVTKANAQNYLKGKLRNIKEFRDFNSDL